MYIYWNKARDIEDNLSVTYDFDTGTAKIQLGGLQSAYISIWDPSFLLRYYGNYVEHKTYLGETMITLIKPGMRAKTFYLSEYVSQPTSLGGASIKNISFGGDTEMKVELDEADCEGLSLSVTESDNITPGQTHSVDVQSSEVDYTIAHPANRLFFVSLRRGNEILDSKTIYRRN